MTAPGHSGGPVRRFSWRLALWFYPFVSATMALNLFLLGLLGPAVGLSALSPLPAIALGLITGLPATWWTTKKVQSLMAEAESDGTPQ